MAGLTKPFLPGITSSTDVQRTERKRDEHLVLETLRLADLRHDLAVAQDIEVLRLVLLVRVPEDIDRRHFLRFFQGHLKPVEIGVVRFIPIRVGIPSIAAWSPPEAPSESKPSGLVAVAPRARLTGLRMSFTHFEGAGGDGGVPVAGQQWLQGRERPASRCVSRRAAGDLGHRHARLGRQLGVSQVFLRQAQRVQRRTPP